MIENYQSKLIKKQQLNHNIYLLEFEIQERKTLNFQAGQYMILKIQQKDGEVLRRMYSIASTSKTNTKQFSLIIKILPEGIAGKYFTYLQIGDISDFQGPAGIFKLENRQKPIIFLATGTGIAPFISMINTHQANILKNKQFKLIWGLKNYNEICLLPYFDEIKNINSKFEYKICLSRETEKIFDYISLGRINNYLDSIKDQLTAYDYYICGNGSVVETLKSHLYNNQIPKEQVFFERYN